MNLAPFSKELYYILKYGISMVQHRCI